MTNEELFRVLNKPMTKKQQANLKKKVDDIFEHARIETKKHIAAMNKSVRESVDRKMAEERLKAEKSRKRKRKRFLNKIKKFIKNIFNS